MTAVKKKPLHIPAHPSSRPTRFPDEVLISTPKYDNLNPNVTHILDRYEEGESVKKHGSLDVLMFLMEQEAEILSTISRRLEALVVRLDSQWAIPDEGSTSKKVNADLGVLASLHTGMAKISGTRTEITTHLDRLLDLL